MTSSRCSGTAPWEWGRSLRCWIPSRCMWWLVSDHSHHFTLRGVRVSAHASLTHVTVLFCVSTVHCLRLTAKRNAFEFIPVDSFQFSSFLADHCVDVVRHFRHLKHFLLPLVLDLVSAFGSIPQQYSLTPADGIQHDVLIKTRLPFRRFVLHPSSCLSVCEVQVSAVMQDPVRARCQGFCVQHGVDGESGLSTDIKK